MVEEEKKDSKDISNSNFSYDSSHLTNSDTDMKSKKVMEETKKQLESVKKQIIKKYPFTMAIGIAPPQFANKFDEEFGLNDEEKKDKPMHLIIIFPEDKFKEIIKIKPELIKEFKDIKPKVWLNFLTPVDVWNFCLDSKFDIVEGLSMSYPLYDKDGFLGSLRVSQIHKSLVLGRFEKYIYSYVIGGSFVRGESIKTSDVDVYVIIDDTDVKRMSRVELKERLRGIIYQQVAEAGEFAGVKNKLSPQVYLLTEFWEGVKEASPVMFTFLRDGLPLYDRGGFLPWKMLLKMGKIKPSQESIDMFLGMGEKTIKIVEQRLLDIVMSDIFWGVIYPTQALLMLYGIPPPNVYETVKEFKRIFVEKEKIIEKKYYSLLENIAINYYKGYEHGKIKKITGKEIDQLLMDFESYTERLKELRIKIEERAQNKTVEEIHSEIFSLLKNLFGKKTERELVKYFEKELVNKGRVEPNSIHILNELSDVKRKLKNKKKPTKYEVERIRKNATQLINRIIEYGQRCDLEELKKIQIKLKFKNKQADLFLTKPYFLIIDNKINKLQDNKLVESNQQEFENIISMQKGNPTQLDSKSMSLIKKEFGNFDIFF